jgi:alcohol dehydrogenase class IV
MSRRIQFEFATSNRILFGVGALQQAPKVAVKFGRRALLVLGIENSYSNQLISSLNSNQVLVTPFPIDSEPSIGLVQEACSLAVKSRCDLVIGFGGGSAIDTAKAIAALLANPGDIFDYLEVIGRSLPMKNPSLPVIAIPTTAGTGAEVTRNAVIYSPQHQVKVSLRSPTMLPRLALVDPELTMDLPPSITASTGLDALTQVIEPFVSNQANPLTDALCREGMARAARSLRKVYFTGNDLEARQDMCLTSLCGGLALANSKLGAVHGFAGVLGGMFPGPHGAICARLLPFVMTANVNGLTNRAPDAVVLQRYNEIGQILTGKPNAGAEDAVTWIEALAGELVVPPLASYGVREADIPEVVAKSAQASSMKGNPISLSEDELTKILMKAL